MKEEELVVINHLAKAYNEFIKLEIQNVDDQQDFARKIRELQSLVMQREAVRNNPEFFSLYAYETKKPK